MIHHHPAKHTYLALITKEKVVKDASGRVVVCEVDVHIVTNHELCKITISIYGLSWIFPNYNLHQVPHHFRSDA